jgi:hypothetical protein
MKSKQFLLILLVLYIGSAIGTYAVRAMFDTSPSSINSDGQSVPTFEEETALGALLSIDPSEPKDQSCPLNGKLYTKTEANAWQARRPLAVMIENSPDARPQSGLSSADVVFEAVAEGGVTRFMAMYYCGVQAVDTTIAPVRSARTYFVDWASGFNRPLYTHVGGANTPGPANAIGQIADYGWALENDLNQFSIGYPTFVRNAARLDREVATEHTMETTSEKLWAVAEKRGWTNMSPEMKVGRTVVPAKDWQESYTGWTFASSNEAPGTTTSIAYDFWSGYNQYSVKWQFDAATKTYARTLAGEPHVDLNTDKQISASVVIVLLTAEKGPIDELKHMLYKTTGSGKALVYQNGQEMTATWTKKTRESELQFTDSKGKELVFQPGLVWISVVDDSTTVDASGV